MTDENKKLNVSRQQERLFSDMSELVMDESMDSESFLKSLTELMDSEEYSELSDELADEPVTETLDVFDEKGNKADVARSVSAESITEEWDVDGADSSDDWNINRYQNYSDDDFYDYDDDDEVAEVEWEELFPAVNSRRRAKTETVNAESEAAETVKDETEVVEAEKVVTDATESEKKSGTITASLLVSSEALKDAMSEEFPLELGDIEMVSKEAVTCSEESLAAVEIAENIESVENPKLTDEVKSEQGFEMTEEAENFEAGDSDTRAGAEKSEDAEIVAAAGESTESSGKADDCALEGSSDKATDGESKENTDTDVEGEKELTPEEIKARKRSKLMWNLVSVACMLVFLYCVWELANYFITGSKYKNEMKEVQDIVGNIAVEPVIIEPEVTEIFFPDEVIYVEDKGSVVLNNEITDEWAETYKTLVELNPDCMGWIQIPDTNIDYPVMYTPNDYDKYLYLNFEEDYQFRGLPFLAEGTVLNKSQNYIMYGHYMKDGTAFQHLNKYLDRNWVKEHPYAYFYTAYDQGVYQVMDVVITKVFKEDDECFKYYNYSGELSEEDFNTYVYYMDKMSSVDTGVEAVYGDKLISLSTCFRHYDEDGRLVVVFKRIQ